MWLICWAVSASTQNEGLLLPTMIHCCSLCPPRGKHMAPHWWVFVFSCKSFSWKRAFDIFTPKIVHGADVSQSDWLIKTTPPPDSFNSWQFNVYVKRFTSAQSGDVLFFIRAACTSTNTPKRGRKRKCKSPSPLKVVGVGVLLQHSDCGISSKITARSNTLLETRRYSKWARQETFCSTSQRPKSLLRTLRLLGGFDFLTVALFNLPHVLEGTRFLSLTAQWGQSPKRYANAACISQCMC